HLGGFGGSLRIHALSSFLNDVRPNGGGAGVFECDSTLRPEAACHLRPDRETRTAHAGEIRRYDDEQPKHQRLLERMMPIPDRPSAAEDPSGDHLSDSDHLAVLGYGASFERSMSPWANFALGFTYLSPLVGVYSLLAVA